MTQEPEIERMPLAPPPRPGRWRVSLRELLGLVTIVALTSGLVVTLLRLTSVESELKEIRREVGYLGPTDPGQIAAVRVPNQSQLTYRVRIRVPGSPPYRVAYSALLPRESVTPDWYGAIQLPPGESLLTLRVGADPRDNRWKIGVHVDSPPFQNRMATALPDHQVAAFRQTADVVSTGIGRQTVRTEIGRTLRLLDERWLVGEGSLLLYGESAPPRDQIGIYAELQPDLGPL